MWTWERSSRSEAENLRIWLVIRRCWSAKRSNSESSSVRPRKNSATSELTDVPASAALILADRYTSSGTDTVMFFTGSQYHSFTFCPKVFPSSGADVRGRGLSGSAARAVP